MTGIKVSITKLFPEKFTSNCVQIENVYHSDQLFLLCETTEDCALKKIISGRYDVSINYLCFRSRMTLNILKLVEYT